VDGGGPLAITSEIAVPNDLQVQLVSPDGKYVWSRDDERRAWLHSLARSSAPRQIQGLLPEETIAGWAADSRSLFVYRSDSFPLAIYRFDFLSGQRKKVKEVLSKEPLGLSRPVWVRISPDAKYIAYSYQYRISELYLVTGLK